MPALVEIVDAVGHDVEVLVDGGIRRGSDVARAIALGARAAMVGRPWVFALTAGQAGVERMLEIFRTDLDRTLRPLGCAAVQAPDRSYLSHPFRSEESRVGKECVSTLISRGAPSHKKKKKTIR